MVDNPPRGMPRVLARLTYADVAGAVGFLESAFGFSERPDARVVDADGRVALTELDVFDSCIMLGAEGAHGLASPVSLGGTTQALIVYVDGIDAHYQRARAGGADIVSDPADQFWGDRRYEARDPEGHCWSFHEHLRDVSPEEMAKALAGLGFDK
ncbi:MAG: hypothetical protein RIC56_01905 [Pseudomonadales bacterium]